MGRIWIRTSGNALRGAKTALLMLGILTGAGQLRAAESWQTALAQMPLTGKIDELNRTNCVKTMLSAFRSNEVVKAIIFMPGATDEFYLFRRARAKLTNASPTLLDAVSALTNQTLIRADFRSPLLLLHTEGDLLEPQIKVEDEATAQRLKRAGFVPHLEANDGDWDFVQPILKWSLKMDVRPWRFSHDEAWHFYRHSFAAWGLTGWEALEVTALAGKSRFTVRRRQVVFEVDRSIK
jgi:hypothetical protein